MPRDDLSINFVQRMPQPEPLDPALILDDWINRVQNLPEEIRFMLEEISDKDRHAAECGRIIEDRDGKIQKWIKTQGSLEPNPREEALRPQIRENFAKADTFTAEKIALTQKLQSIMDKHLRGLDSQIKLLYDRAEPGFLEPDEVPSLLRASATNHSAPSARAVNPAANHVATPAPATPITTVANNPVPTLNKVPNPQIRHAQVHQHASSAPATPAASMILNRQQRESSAGPGSTLPKRGPRANTGLGSVPVTSSGLARHSSLGPGTPKASTGAGLGGTVRAGSAGPRAGSIKGSAVSQAGRKASTPTAVGRKKVLAANGNKSSLSRVKKSTKNSPAPSTADSELSEAESGTGEDDDDEKRKGQRASGTPAGDAKAGDADEDMADADDDEAGDDKKYCLCQNVSFGDMVACDNDNCPFEWFHWTCVGLKSEPNGTWYCPVCAEKTGKKTK